jgi:hypothetical protein
VDQKYQHILQSGDCLSIDRLRLYYEGRLPASERFLVERHLLSCEICSDLLEGLSTFDDTLEFARAEADLKKKIHAVLNKKEDRKRRLVIYRRMAIAASIIILCSLSLFVYYQVNTNIKNQVAETSQTGAAAVQPTVIADTLAEVKPEMSDKKVIRMTIAKTQQIETKLKETVADDIAITDTEMEAKRQVINMDTITTNIAVVEKKDEINDTSQVQITEALSGRISGLEVRRNNFFAAKISAERASDAPAIISNTGKLTGVVRDESGNPIPGVTVVLQGSTNGTVTDINGRFSLQELPSEGQLNFNYIGYQPETISYPNDSLDMVTMVPEMLALDEVVVVGYGTKKKQDVTGSISTITMDEEPKAYDPEAARQQKLNEIQRLKNQPDYYSDWKSIKKVVIKYLQIDDSVNALTALDQLRQLLTDESSQAIINQSVSHIEKGEYKPALKKIKKLKE